MSRPPKHTAVSDVAIGRAEWAPKDRQRGRVKPVSVTDDYIRDQVVGFLRQPWSKSCVDNGKHIYFDASYDRTQLTRVIGNMRAEGFELYWVGSSKERFGHLHMPASRCNRLDRERKK